MAEFLYLFGMAAVAVNALTGVIEAERKELDLLGAIIIAIVTALGGGTLRDLLLDRQVFWIADQTYLMTAMLAGVGTFFVIRKRSLPPQWFLVPDAIGLALFTVIGTQAAINWHTPWLPTSLLGVVTGVFGGILRDILCNEVPLVLRVGELYATAAWIGAIALIVLQQAGYDPVLSGWVAMGIILIIRLAAIRFQLTLPVLPKKN